MKTTKFLAAALVAALLGACATPQAPSPITDTAQRTPQLSTLTKLINDAGLAETLRGPGPFTVFAPSDEAFKAVPAKTLDELSKDKELLKSVLTYHVLPSKVMAADISGKKTAAKSVEGGDVMVDATDGVKINDGKVVTADVAASNGVIHAIDTVLMPKM